MAGQRVTSAGGYRPELHGLRATSILLVAIYHVWIGRVSGGIDIFLLISSFLLMQTFLRRIDNDRPLDLVGYWLKAFRRLMPPALITILGTILAVIAFFPRTRIRGVLDEALASIGYYENWFLAYNSFDYYADKSTVSPLQHFWSLAMQGQIFLIWPALIALCFVIARFAGWRVRPVLGVAFGAIFAGSLAWSIYATANDQTFSYFSTWTRLWEFAMGALLALVLPTIEARFGYGPGKPLAGSSRSLIVRGIAGWMGLAAVISCGMVLDVEGMFPGYAALWPTCAALVVITAGNTGMPWGADRLLSSRPLQFLGDISYALYLIHWPALIAMYQLVGESSLTISQGTFVLVISIAMAVLLTRWVDEPIRYSTFLSAKYRRSLLVIGICLAIGFATPYGLNTALDIRAQRAAALAERNNPGAKTLYFTDLDEPDPDATLLPLPENLSLEWAGGGIGECSGDLEAPGPQAQGLCHVRTEGGTRVVLIGNSRMEQYMPMFDEAAKRFDWEIISFLQPGCAFPRVEDPSVQPEGCLEWIQEAYDYVDQVSPQIVIMATSLVIIDRAEHTMPNADEAIERFTSAGIDVIGVRDEPRTPVDPMECMNGYLDEMASGSEPEAERFTEASVACSFAKSETYATGDPSAPLINHVRGDGRLILLDPSPWMCPNGTCPMIIGNIFVYIDAHHITSTYSATMAPMVARELANYFDGR